MMKRNQSGFTLIEIAIVLVIIGLLLGGVLKGQELINSAKVKNLAADFKNIPVFIYSYQDKFRSLPGDDSNAKNHLDTTAIQAASATAGNGVINGNWYDTAVTSESYVFWQHVRLAGLAPGPTDTTLGQALLPTNASGGFIGIQSGTNTPASSPIKDSAGNAIRGSYVICSTGILGKFVKQLDIQMDDGITDSGSMMAIAGTTLGTTATGVGGIDDATTYTVCMGV